MRPVFTRAAWLAAVLAASWVGLAACSGSSGAGGGAAGGAGTTAGSVVVPGPGQVFVTGDVAHFSADDAQIATPLASPFTLSATERGAGNATIENALVAGRRSTISWGTGTPLPISSTGPGGLDLGAAHVDVDAGGVTWGLDGVARGFLPGTYRAGAPVAVGSGGIAAPRDSVDFTADDKTVITTRGGVVVHLDPRPLVVSGPGKVAVSGRLRVETPAAAKAAATVTFGPGAFKVTLTPGGSGARMDSVLQGPFTAT
ncbi:MAG: hypothetical protein ABR511_14635 [Acidimicrobiales bacterium]